VNLSLLLPVYQAAVSLDFTAILKEQMELFRTKTASSAGEVETPVQLRDPRHLREGGQCRVLEPYDTTQELIVKTAYMSCLYLPQQN
jgi:hypothetical protein